MVEHDGFQEGIEVRLTPLGAHALFGSPMHELTNRVVELDDLIGRDAGELSSASGTSPAGSGASRSWTRRSPLGRRVPCSLRAELSWAWGRMRASAGRANVGALAAELGWSHRRLIARFRESIGLPPKTLGRVLRFERVSRGCSRTSRSRGSRRSPSTAATTTRPT